MDFANLDVILDFNAAEGDKIDVSTIDAMQGVNGDQDFTFVGEYFTAGGFTAAGQAAYYSDGVEPTSCSTPIQSLKTTSNW